MQTRRVTADGENLRVAVQAGDGVPIVICGELGGNLELLAPFIEALPDSEIIVFDWPGTGCSSQPQRARRMGGYVRLLAALLNELGYDEPVDLLGVGWSGLLVQKFAYQFEQRVRRLVLVSTSPGHLMFPGRLESLLRIATPSRFAHARRGAEESTDVYGGRSKHEPELIRENAEDAILPTRRGYFYPLLATIGFSSLPWLHRLRQPTLIIAGDDDPIVPLVNARLLNLLIPRSRLQVIMGGGHLLLVTRTDDVARAVKSFLQRRDASDELPTKDTL